MATKYSQIQPNAVFETTSGTFRKVDDLWFADITGDFESMWSPIFDTTIILSGEAVVAEPETTTEPKFIVDEQSRLMKPNPKYGKVAEAPTVAVDNLAEEAFGEMWGSAQFDCGPEDYTYMGEESVAAVKAMSNLASIVGLVGNSTIYGAIIETLNDAFVNKKVAKKAVKKVAKKAAKKAVKKAPAKRKRK